MNVCGCYSVILHTLLLSIRQSLQTTDPKVSPHISVRPRPDCNFFSYLVKTTGLSNDRSPVGSHFFGPTPGRTATLVVVRLGVGVLWKPKHGLNPRFKLLHFHKKKAHEESNVLLCKSMNIQRLWRSALCIRYGGGPNPPLGFRVGLDPSQLLTWKKPQFTLSLCAEGQWNCSWGGRV